MFKLLIFCLLFSLSSCSQSNTEKVDLGKKDLQMACDEVMQSFMKGKLDDMMQKLKDHSHFDSNTVDSIQLRVLEHFNTVYPIYGRPLSFDFIREISVKDIITKRYYIIRFERFYIKFEFTLYNNGKDWKIVEFNYNEEVLELLEFTN